MANIREEFAVDPFKCLPKDISMQKREIPEGGNENIELLERLFTAKAAEIEPDIVSELEILINTVCEQ